MTLPSSAIWDMSYDFWSIFPGLGIGLEGLEKAMYEFFGV